MNKLATAFLSCIRANDRIGSKPALIKKCLAEFNLTRDRSVYYTKAFAVRFSYSATGSFSNTVLSLSNLQKYDEIPFFVCLVTKGTNRVYLANSTFLSKISHSSHQLRVNNIRGSFNGSDIMKEFNGLANEPTNFEQLFNIHSGLGFEGNLPRIVEATTNIVPSGEKFALSNSDRANITGSIARAVSFVNSTDYKELLADLDARVANFSKEIVIASLIENVNIRGRIIEYLIAGEDESLRKEIVKCLKANESITPRFATENTLGDYTRDFANFHTETDVKTKIMVLNSNPKAYNIDKMLEFLSRDKTVFMFYFVGIDPGKIVSKVLTSMFQEQLVRATILLKHWAGRNSRGVTQLEGSTIHNLLVSPSNKIDVSAGKELVDRLMAL